MIQKALIVINLIFAPLFIFGQSRYVLIDSLFVNDTVRVNEVEMWSEKYKADFSIFNIMYNYPAEYSDSGTSLKPKNKYLISITAFPNFKKGKTIWKKTNLKKIDKSKIIDYRDLEKEIVPRLRNYDATINDSVLIDCDLALIVKRSNGYYVSQSGTCAQFYEIKENHPVYVYPGAGKFYELNTNCPPYFIEDYYLNDRRYGFVSQILQLMFLSKKGIYATRWYRFENVRRYKFWSLDKLCHIKVLEYDDHIGIIGSTIGYRLNPDVEVYDIDSEISGINGIEGYKYSLRSFLRTYYESLGLSPKIDPEAGFQ
jgi:hypothetical protein